MSLTPNEILRCEQCDAPLDSLTSVSGCLNCLLLGGPNETLKSLEENRRFQHYEVNLLPDGVSLWELGRGAMGKTYRAVDINLGSPVALKVISTRYSGDLKARERFRREARAAAQLRHSNVATVFHFGETQAGQCFYAMELVEGETLEARVRRDGPLPVCVAVDVAEQVARALAAAETHGLIHRDLKPSNIMVVANDADTAEAAPSPLWSLRKSATGAPPPQLTVKVIDFGLAKAVAAAEENSDQDHAGFSGTPGFASPEQLTITDPAAATLDVRSDIYSLGATLWYLLCGKTLFIAQTLKELREEQLHPLPVESRRVGTAKVPEPLVTLLRSMLTIDPAKRPQSAKELLARLRRCREAIEARPRRRRRLQLAALAFLTISGLALTSYLWYHQHVREHAPAAMPTAPQRSIAVLPFENLSNDREDASFADGVQDDILTKLAKIADLKVISRTSVMQYRGKHNAREIGAALGVSHMLEGSVRKTGGWLHINAQLIDTRSDSHIWAEQYDRDLSDMFAVQSEIAQTVAEKLQVQISPAEKAVIERPPTADLTAFNLYSRAKNLLLMPVFSSNAKANLLQAADLLNQAVAHDPAYFGGYCQLAHTHDLLYFLGFDHTPERLAFAEAAVLAAFRLRPDAGEAHLARAEHLYRGYRDYAGALAELEIGGTSLSNDPQIFELRGYIERRRPGGNQEEALGNLERAIELDPRNVFMLQQIALSYDNLRRYPDEEATLDRALAVQPSDTETKIARAFVALDWKADTLPLHRVIDEIRAKHPAAVQGAADRWLICALAERDAPAAADALRATSETCALNDDNIYFNRSFAEGLIARMTKDDYKAQSAFTAAHIEQENAIQGQPNYGPAMCVLGLTDAALKHKDEALREGRRAVELLPVEKDTISGPAMIKYLAMIAAWVGDRDLACEQLAIAARLPSGVSYGQLKLLPFWDPLRGDPRFEKIVASLAPKDADVTR